MLLNNNVFCRLLVKLHVYFEVHSRSEWSIWCLESSGVQSPLARSDMQRFQRRWCSLALFLIQHVYGYNTTYSVTREHSVNVDLSVMNVAVCWCSAQYCALNKCTNSCHPVFMHVTITTLVCHMYFGSLPLASKCCAHWLWGCSVAIATSGPGHATAWVGGAPQHTWYLSI